MTGRAHDSGHPPRTYLLTATFTPASSPKVKDSQGRTPWSGRRDATSAADHVKRSLGKRNDPRSERVEGATPLTFCEIVPFSLLLLFLLSRRVVCCHC